MGGPILRPVQSAAENVDSYLAEVPDARRPVLSALREVLRAELAGYDEGMAHGMPVYGRGGAVEVAFASQRQHIAVYLGQEVLTAHEEALAGVARGKGCLRFRRPEQLDLELIRTLARATRETAG